MRDIDREDVRMLTTVEKVSNTRYARVKSPAHPPQTAASNLLNGTGTVNMKFPTPWGYILQRSVRDADINSSTGPGTSQRPSLLFSAQPIYNNNRPPRCLE